MKVLIFDQLQEEMQLDPDTVPEGLATPDPWGLDEKYPPTLLELLASINCALDDGLPQAHGVDDGFDREGGAVNS